jgi:hypothetical protein
MRYVTLPHLGTVLVTPCPGRPGHFLWLDGFGWHDCVPAEDALILG